MAAQPFKSGFVSIVGRPNVGKSTLMNRLVGEKLSIVTPKAQTTRHRIMGIWNGPDYQIVYSDTPGILEPRYELHKAMMNYVSVSLEDADLVLLITEPDEKPDPKILARLKKIQVPIILALNKIDKLGDKSVEAALLPWQSIDTLASMGVSAKKGSYTDRLRDLILKHLPEHPAYFPKDQLTDRSERFFAAEIIREQIFLNYEEEVPYSCQVSIDAFKEKDNVLAISAVIYVERDSQKGIVIGKGGQALKKVGTEARKGLEEFFGKKVHLETHVKVADQWRSHRESLRRFGYNE
jgi:GTP-binding protein Era